MMSVGHPRAASSHWPNSEVRGGASEWCENCCTIDEIKDGLRPTVIDPGTPFGEPAAPLRLCGKWTVASMVVAAYFAPPAVAGAKAHHYLVVCGTTKSRALIQSMGVSAACKVVPPDTKHEPRRPSPSICPWVSAPDTSHPPKTGEIWGTRSTVGSRNAGGGRE
jgi:hypothetical protein